ncbi:MAG: CBS domain-containing protein [Desulfovibrio sp.]|nr:CBS domain-containing protein [Desulfovibrio sp.]
MTARQTIITCHTNADFDAFAAMLCARHLYPQALLYFPGTQENRLKKYFEKVEPLYDFVDAPQLTSLEIEKIVIVDTRQPSRVPHIAHLLKANAPIEIWDHHPQSNNDLANARVNYCKCGAVTSFLVLELKKRGLKITPEEATILALGIYEDTGAFTYTSTTTHDFAAAAWLAEQGMSIDEVAEVEMHQFSGLQIQLLNTLLENSQSYRIHQQEVVLSELVLEEYLDCAFLTYQFMEMGRHQVVFVLCQMAERIQIIARSKTESINVGDICAVFGGGGHAYAASASVKNLSPADIKEAILRQLQLQNTPQTHVRTFMSTPPIGVQTTTLIREADELMFHFGLKSIPVYKPGTHSLAGILDVQTAQRAVTHHLSEVCVEDYMQTHVLSVNPEDDMSDVVKIIIQNHQRMVPVVENKNVVGIVTRTDLINLFAEISVQDSTSKTTRYFPIERMIKERLPNWILDLLQKASSVARYLNLPVYVIGGFVRDLLLQTPNHDIDLVVEGNGEEFALALANLLQGRVSKHEKFMTAIVIFKDETGTEQRIDVATAMLEYYEHPAALPLVEVSPIKMDLSRRDFTINTLAIRLDKDSDKVVDFFGGQRDLKDGVIRVLHTLSFVEDPSRCLRAVRFEQRFGFRLSKNTTKLIKNAVQLKVLERLEHQRLFYEFRQICHEQDPANCLFRLYELGILQELFPRTVLSKNKQRLLIQIKKFIMWYNMLYKKEKIQAWIIYLWGLNLGLNYKECKNNLQKLHLSHTHLDYILTNRSKMHYLTQKAELFCNEKNPKISALYALFRQVEINMVIYIMATVKNENLAKYLSKYVTEWRDATCDLRGRDLKAMNLTPGPIYKKILDAVLYAKLDGKVTDRQSQLALAKQLCKKFS